MQICLPLCWDASRVAAFTNQEHNTSLRAIVRGQC